MDINNLTLEEIEKLQNKLAFLQQEKISLYKARKRALLIPEKTEFNPNFFIHNTLPDFIFAYPKEDLKLISEYPEWMTNWKQKKPTQYWYLFDYENFYITVELIKNPKLMGYYESDLRNILNLNIGDPLWKHGKYYFAIGPENLLKIFKNFPESEINKWTLKFKILLVKTIEEFFDKVSLRKELDQVTLQTVDEYIKNKLNNKYPIETKENNAFKNQKLGLLYTTNFMPFALLWEMGTGKTRTAIETFIFYKQRGAIDKCLIVCPLSVINNWENEIYKWSNCSFTILRGTKEEKLSLLENEETDFYITNYEALLTFGEILHQWVNESTMIVADESTKVKNYNAKRTKELIKLGKYTKYKMIMTGTPITQHAYDLFAPFLFLDNGESFGLSYQKFLWKYFHQNGYKLIPYRDSLEKISNKMYFKGLRFLKKDCIDIPEKIYVQRIVELPEYNKKKYEEMKNYAITEIENSEKVTAAIILVQLLRLSQITSGFVKDELGQEINFTENPKLDCLEEIFDETNEEKIIVWTRFHRDVENISGLCKKKQIKTVSLYGDIKPEERNKNIEKFQNEPEIKVLIGTPGTGGLGINLTAANIVIYYSNSYSLQERLQSEDRTHRAGQTNKVTYIDILCKNTIDIGISKILKAKKNLADIITRDNLREII